MSNMQPQLPDLLSQLCEKPQRVKTPSAEITITVLTELLTDFELECAGTFHELILRRYPQRANTFHLLYKYHNGNEFVQRTLPIDIMQNGVSVHAMHDQIIQHFNQREPTTHV